MGSLLALSAQHLSRIKSDSKEIYEARAAFHQDIALRSARLEMANVTERNCHALFAFSSLIAYCAFARPREPGSLAFIVGSKDTEETAQWLVLTRGVHSILVSASDWIQAGDLAPLLQRDLIPEQVEIPPLDFDNRLSELHPLVCNDSSGWDDRQTYANSIEELRKSFALYYDPDNGICDVTAIFTWPVKVSQHYISLLSRQTPEAMAILAHYCALLKELDSYWWAEGLGFHLVSTISQLLDARNRKWIRWPLAEILEI